MRQVFLVLLAVLTTAFIVVTWPFVQAAFVAATLAIIFWPLQRFLERHVGGHRTPAAVLSTLAIGLCVILPLAVMGSIIATKIGTFLQTVSAQLQGDQLSTAAREVVVWFRDWIERFGGSAPLAQEIQSALVAALRTAGNRLTEASPRVLSGTLLFIANFFVMFVFLFVFLAEGRRLSTWAEETVPLKKAHWREIARNVRIAITTSLVALIAIGVVQGSLLGIGFWIVGFEYAAGWWLVAMIVCIVPVVGAASTYLVASAVLYATGRPIAALLFLAFGVGIVSQVDLLIRSFVIRGSSRIHPVLLFVTLIGAVRLVGPIGVIAGPVLLVIFLAALRIYRREFATPGS